MDNQSVKKIQEIFGESKTRAAIPERAKMVKDFKMIKPVDPCDVNWKNMQIKGGERCLRIFCFCFSLSILIYISFLA